MIRLGPDNQSLRVLVPQNDRISRTGSSFVNLFLVELLHQRRDAAKLFTIEHLKNAGLAGDNWFPPLLKLPHDVLSGLNIARRTGHNQASGRGIDGNGQAGPGFTTRQLICSGIRDGLLHSNQVKGLDAKHPGDVHRCDWLWIPSLGAGSVHLQNEVLDYLKLARHRCRGNDAIQLGIDNDAGLELGRCCRLAFLGNAVNSLANHRGQLFRTHLGGMKNFHLAGFAFAGFKFPDQFCSQRQRPNRAKEHERAGGLIIDGRDVGGGIRIEHIKFFRFVVPLDLLGS